MREESNRHVPVDIEERRSKDVIRAVSGGGDAIGVCWAASTSRAWSIDPFEKTSWSWRPMRAIGWPGAPAFAEQTLDFEHVGLQPATAVYAMLHRAAARYGRMLSDRVVVSNFDAALRVVEADLDISVVSRQIAMRHLQEKRFHVITCTDAWAKRRFAVCFRDKAALQPAATRLLEFLVSKAIVYA